MCIDLVPAVVPVADDRLDRISAQLEAVTDRLDAARARTQRWHELAAELATVAGPGMAMLTGTLAEAESRGYADFVRGGAAIADRIVTSFDADDLAALGDNVVLILNTVKELTQPEVMDLLHRSALNLQDGEAGAGPPPSTLALLRQLRDPQVRRGLDRLLGMLRTIGADQVVPSPTRRTTKE